MKYAIFSDVHANLEALEAVIGHAEDRGVDRFVCLGDLVGYGADPGPVVELIIERASVIVAGNHDYAVAGKLALEQFNEHAREAAKWTIDQLPSSSIQKLHELPLLDTRDDITFVHSCIGAPEKFEYLISRIDAHLNFQEMETGIGFMGHSHVPGNFYLADDLHFNRDELLTLRDDERALVNVGSVGQPRDEDPRACYVTYDTGDRSISVHRVKYDVVTAANKIYDAGLAPALAERLYEGK